MKQTIRLNESQLRQVIREAVNNILNERQWNQGSNYVTTDGYENNGQGAERINFGKNRRAYSLRNTDNGYRNHDRISVTKGQGVNGLSRMKYGNGGMNNGQLESIIDELSEYIGATPEQIKSALGLE